MLLRETRAEEVDKIARILLKKYPSPKELSKAKISDIASLIKPLGLHKIRSKAIIAVASRLSSINYRIFLSHYDNIISLPHVGRYTTNAVLCMSYNKQVPMVDSNIVRLMNRVFGINKPIEVHKADYLWSFVNSLIPKGKAREFNLAMLDLTALICLPGIPKCGECPIESVCKYKNQLWG